MLRDNARGIGDLLLITESLMIFEIVDVDILVDGEYFYVPRSITRSPAWSEKLILMIEQT